MVFDHGGICPCGRRTYLFGQCVKCIGNEAKETVAEALERLDEAEADARDLGPGVYAGPLAAVQPAEASSERLLVLTDAAVLRASKAAADGAGELEDVQVTVFEWQSKDRLQVDAVRNRRKPFSMDGHDC